VGALVGGVTALVVSTAGAADELAELADKTGLTTTQLQEFKYIGEQTGTSLETVTGSLAKVVRSMDAAARTGKGPAAEAFAALGVSVAGVDGELRSSQDVFGEVLDALGGVGNETERDALAMAIFGKSAQELNPLIKAGSDGIAEMSGQAHDLGAVMSEEAVAGLAGLNDMIAGLKLGFQGWAGTLASGFVPIFREVIGSVQEFMASPAVQSGIADFMAGVKSFAEGAATAIGTFVDKLQAGQPPVIAFVNAIWGLAPPEVRTFLLSLTRDILPSLSAWFTENVSPIIDMVTQFVSWQDVLIALGVVAASIVLPALLGIVAAAAPVILVGAALVGAIALVRTAWETDWGGIRTAVEGFVSETLPILWQKAQEVWAWITDTAIPTLQTWGQAIADFVMPKFNDLKTILAAFIAEILPPLQLAWQSLVTVWQTEVGPALGELWTSLQELFAELGLGTGDTDIWSVAMGTLKLILAGVVLGVEGLTPVIHLVGDALEFSLGMTRSMVDGLTSLKRGAETLIAPLQNVAGRIGDMIDRAQDMPGWLIPGSPTPFELAIRGIGSAVRALPEMSLGVTGPAPGRSGAALAGAGGSPSPGGITIGSITIQASSYEEGQAAGRGFVEELRRQGMPVGI